MSAQIRVGFLYRFLFRTKPRFVSGAVTDKGQLRLDWVINALNKKTL
jgi:hypothetical protein